MANIPKFFKDGESNPHRLVLPLLPNNNWSYSYDQLEDMMMHVGYQYFLREMIAKIKGRSLDVQMEWQNIGFAPNYPKMGREFRLYFYLVDDSGHPVSEIPFRLIYPHGYRLVRAIMNNPPTGFHIELNCPHLLSVGYIRLGWQSSIKGQENQSNYHLATEI